MGTDRLYYTDSYLTDFQARVVDRSPDGLRLYLDRTAFYPASGGQPHDTGLLAGVPVTEVVDEGDRIAHLTAAPVEGVEVECRVDWPRRFDHMQQHTGQHLLSATIIELYGIPTVSFHLGEDISTIDLVTSALDPEQVIAAERRANERVVENLPVTVTYETPEEARDLRVPSDRQGLLRIVTIQGLDRIACGGTHVRATGEVGPVLIRRLERIRGNVRLEFLCGARALRRTRADFDALSRIARTLGSSLDDAPALVAAQREGLDASERSRRKVAAELAGLRGRELYDATTPDAAGIRRVTRRLPAGALDDELRALAQGFIARSRAIFLVTIEDPPSILLAASSDSGVHAGNTLKEALAAAGGRGGGNAQLAQGSVSSRQALEAVVTRCNDTGP
jgi:alanyl-tRNA synthetase